jgi:hypothetical protein
VIVEFELFTIVIANKTANRFIMDSQPSRKVRTYERRQSAPTGYSSRSPSPPTIDTPFLETPSSPICSACPFDIAHFNQARPRSRFSPEPLLPDLPDIDPEKANRYLNTPRLVSLWA